MSLRSRFAGLTLTVIAVGTLPASRAEAQRPAPGATAGNAIAYAPWSSRSFRLSLTKRTTMSTPDSTGTERVDSAAVLLSIGASARGDSVLLSVRLDSVLFAQWSRMPSDAASAEYAITPHGWAASTHAGTTPLQEFILSGLERTLARLPVGSASAGTAWRDSLVVSRPDVHTVDRHRTALRAAGWEAAGSERALRISGLDSFLVSTPDVPAGTMGWASAQGVARLTTLVGAAGAPVRSSASSEMLGSVLFDKMITVRLAEQTTLERAVAITAAPLARGPDSSAGAALCRPDEQVIFAAAIERSTRLVALCGSKLLDHDNGYLQYRYGPADNIELVYPASLAATRTAFRYIRYTRPQVTYATIRFENNGFLYSIHEASNGEETPPNNSAYITVTRMSDHRKVAELRCVMPVTGTLMRLEAVVPNRQWTEEDAVEP